MANSSINLSSLDFDTLKANFKEYLKTQSVLKDYDFEGSNMNVLLDVMSYNSYLNSFYLNMIASEMFLDSAQKYDSVVSHAKELNYVPRSSHSAYANVSFSLQTTGIDKKITIPQGTRFSGINSNGTYTFVTNQIVSYTSSNSLFNVENLQIHEGDYFQDSFTVDYDLENQKFILSNQNIDTNSIQVNVIENNGATNSVFQRAQTLFNLNNLSQVYFLQGFENNKYEIVFGDGLFGRSPLNGAIVIVRYIVTHGTEGNGVENFTLLDDLGVVNGGTATASDITTITASLNGANQESIESIRYSAPRYFAAQQRAVSSDDYSSLIVGQFNGEVDDVIIYGGQDLEPKQYGRVVVSIKPTSAEIASDTLKKQIISYLQNYIALPNRVIVSDPDYFYIAIDCSVQYNVNQTTKYPNELKTNILGNILDFSSQHLEKFGDDFRYSRLVTHIDDVDASITSNDTNVRIIKRITPTLRAASSFDIRFNNRPEQEGVYNGVAYPDERVFSSSFFSYIDENDLTWDICYMEDDPSPRILNPNKGSIIIYKYIRGVKTVLNPNIGSIDYETGRVIITNLKVADYTNNISLYLSTLNKDIIASKNMVLTIEADDVNINVIETVK